MAALSEDEQKALAFQVGVLFEALNPRGVPSMTEVKGTGIRFDEPRPVADLYRFAAEGVEDTRTLTLQVAALQGAVRSLASAQGFDPDKLEDIITNAVENALGELRIVRGDDS